MRITANQVTFARLLLMPLLCGLVYADEALRVFGVVVGTLVGLTDLLDGYLARKHGPTVLGGLMDPIADKVFIAVCYIPFADRGWAPWWFVAAVFVRELAVTALRSSFEARGKPMPSDYLAKVKTWVQMAGFGLLILGPIVDRFWIVATLGTLSVALHVGWIVFRVVKRKIWRGGLVGALAFSGPLLVYVVAGRDSLMLAVMASILIITWASAGTYFAAAARVLAGETRAFDRVRLAGAAVVPVLAIAALPHVGRSAWAVVALVAIEIAHHGLDNLLAHDGAADGAAAWGGRMLAEALLLGAALLVPAHAPVLVVAAAVVAATLAAASFVSHRAHYLGDATAPSRPAAAPPAEPQKRAS